MMNASITGEFRHTSIYYSLAKIRVESKNNTNPSYGLTGYTVIRNIDSLPIVKSPNLRNTQSGQNEGSHSAEGYIINSRTLLAEVTEPLEHAF